MDLNKLKYLRLTPDSILKPFNCGDTDLNGFFVDDAKNYLTQLLAVTYFLENDEHTVAYWSLQNDKIAHTDINNNTTKFIERIGKRYLPASKSEFKSYPAVKIGRLAVHQDYQNLKLGKLILDYLKNNFIDNNKTGCKFITVDAYAASTKFYEKNGFEYLSSRDKKSDTRQMYFNLGALDL